MKMVVNDAGKLLLERAHGLLGDGDGNDWDLNPEYTRGIMELICDVLPSPEFDGDKSAQSAYVLGLMVGAGLTG